ncbi:hypothetical protein [Paenibacillus polymyxa]|nr:hypothetical protein [Paenibacillus polymyxa]
MWNTILFYPQEFSPSIPKQIKYSVAAILHYDDVTPADWEGYTYRPSRTGESEKYVVALYKYKRQVPLDGTTYFYNDTDYHKDHPIRSLNDYLRNWSLIINSFGGYSKHLRNKQGHNNVSCNTYTRLRPDKKTLN